MMASLSTFLIAFSIAMVNGSIWSMARLMSEPTLGAVARPTSTLESRIRQIAAAAAPELAIVASVMMPSPSASSSSFSTSVRSRSPSLPEDSIRM